MVVNTWFGGEGSTPFRRTQKKRQVGKLLYSNGLPTFFLPQHITNGYTYYIFATKTSRNE
jgi:hypothetical protein